MCKLLSLLRCCHCKSGASEFGLGGLNLLVSHIGEFRLWDHIPWRIRSVLSEFDPSDNTFFIADVDE